MSLAARPISRRLIGGLVLILANSIPPAGATGSIDPALPTYRAGSRVTLPLNSIGDGAMKALMTAWFDDYRQHQPQAQRGRWEHDSDALAIGALMFELADIAPMTREWQAAETAPYAHQFAGDMMKTPWNLRVATRGGQAVYLTTNRRPGSPLPPAVREFMGYALSREGQAVVAEQAAFESLPAALAAQERVRLEGFVATLDPALMIYRAQRSVSGEIRSVGSDGMKSLLDRWLREFRRLQPGVQAGSRWEHLGTLNGFHALLTRQTDLAPMGRELWAAELAAYRATQGSAAPLEIRVARGGYNTPQRTTAQAIFVHAGNPLAGLTMAQLAEILGQGGAITRWGQLGLTGEWAQRPIRIFMPPRVAPNATSMQLMVLKGAPWADGVQEGAIAQTAQAIAAEPGAIGFGGFEEGGPGLKTLAVARDATGPFIEGDAANASSGRYPLTRFMYIRLNRPTGSAIAPQVREFLRYVLSREGQEPILTSGYFPLSAAEVAEELAKLD